MKNPDYSIGYGKPPAHSQFQPGQSGNPNGRRKGSRNLAADVARELAETLVVTEGGRQRRITKQRAMIKALVARCIKGDVRAASALLRLLPEVERTNRVEADNRAITPVDEEILKAFRDQILGELTPKDPLEGTNHE